MTFKTMRVEIDQTDPSHLAAVENCLQKLGYTAAWMNENPARVVAYADGTYEGYALALKGTCDTSLDQLKTMQTSREPQYSQVVGRLKARSRAPSSTPPMHICQANLCTRLLGYEGFCIACQLRAAKGG